MTRPTILDLDLVVVPREATDEMMDRCCAAWVYLYPSFPGEKPQPTAGEVASTIYSTAISASPYPTAWDDVRKYVEGLEESNTEKDKRIAVFCSEIVSAWNSFGAVAWTADDIADLPYMTGGTIAEQIEELVTQRDTAEARIAELEKRLADAERVIERVPPYLTDMYKAICNGNEAAANGFAEKDELVCAARAYMEGK